jgi:hypothetical protein
MRTFFFLSLFFITINAFSQALPDDDKDGVSNMEDLCPERPGPRENKGCPVEKKEFTEEDKKLFIKNFLLILADVKTGFKTITTGETDWDVATRQGQSRSTVQLFPSFTDKNTSTLIFAQYNGRPLNAYEEKSPLDVNTVASVLLSTLKSKGFIEVNTKGMNSGMEGRSFRSKDAVVQIASNTANGNAVIDIGKFPYYYEKDVVAVGTKPPTKPTKPVVPVKKPTTPPTVAEPNVISLANMIKMANREIKKKATPIFNLFKTTKPTSNFIMSGFDAAFKIKGMYSTMVNEDGDEIIIQTQKEADKTIASLYANPTSSLNQELGSGYEEIIKTDDFLLASYENISINMTQMEDPEYKYATIIFLRSKTPKKELQKENDGMSLADLLDQFGPGMNKILAESETGFEKVRQEFRLTGADGFKHYNTSLPKFEFRFNSIKVGPVVNGSNKLVAKYVMSSRISSEKEAKGMYGLYMDLLNSYFNVSGGENTMTREYQTKDNGHTKYVTITLLKGSLWELYIEAWDKDAKVVN